MSIEDKHKKVELAETNTSLKVMDIIASD